MPLRIPALLAAALCLLAAELPAQSRRSDRASAYLSGDHWSVRAARRVIVLGLVEHGAGWGDGTMSRRAVGEILRGAIAASAGRTPELERVVRGYWRWFAQEFPQTAAELERDAGASPLRGEGALAMGLSVLRDDRAIGAADWIYYGGGGPIPVPARAGLTAGALWSAHPLPYTAAEAGVERGPHAATTASNWRVARAHVVASYRRAGVWFGRRTVRFGPGVGGGVLLNGSVPLTGGGAVLEPARLPWALSKLGPVRVEASLFALDSSAAVRRPWLTSSHVSASPHPRLLLGLSHGAMFGGSGQPPFTFRNFTAMFLYSRATRVTQREFENQLVSGEIRFRPPLGRVPLNLYLEWGSEDNRSAWWDSPGLVVGGELAAVRGVPGLSVGLEHAYFGKPCQPCAYDNEFLGTEWYRHYIFKAGWTDDGRPLGHPLGGHGRELLLYANMDAADARLRSQGRVLFRTRGRVNLFAPERQGREAGAGASAAWRVTPRFDVTADALYLRGLRDAGAWNQLDARTSLRYLF